jgi:hypothetical protein
MKSSESSKIIIGFHAISIYSHDSIEEECFFVDAHSLIARGQFEYKLLLG